MANILVVEDDAATREFFRYVLENSGHRVQTAEDGQKALDAVRESLPDLLILDVMLPEVNGYEICHRLKGAPATQALKVLMVTAKAFPADRREGERAGADGFLVKPVHPKELQEHVHRLLSDGAAPGGA